MYGVNLGASPITYVFTPTPLKTNTVKLQNIGSTNVYVGPYDNLSVPVSYGLPLTPGKFLDLTFPPSSSPTVYASAGYLPGTASATLGTGGIATVGTTKLTVTTMSTQFTGGVTLQLGNGTNQELVVVASTASTVVTLANPTLLYHPATDPMTLVTSVAGQLSVNTAAF